MKISMKIKIKNFEKNFYITESVVQSKFKLTVAPIAIFTIANTNMQHPPPPAGAFLSSMFNVTIY